MLGLIRLFVALAGLALISYIRLTEARQCYQCSGINCHRTSFLQTTECADNLDYCAVVFENQQVQAQDCLTALTDTARSNCGTESNDCLLCEEDLCNTAGPKEFRCVQCDSNEHDYCDNGGDALTPTICPISRASNSYCFTRIAAGRTTRGCAISLEEQTACLTDENCSICSPFELENCNSPKIESTDESQTTGAQPITTTPTTTTTLITNPPLITTIPTTEQPIITPTISTTIIDPASPTTTSTTTTTDNGNNAATSNIMSTFMISFGIIICGIINMIDL